MDNTRPIPNMERVLKLTKRLAILPRLYRGLHTKDIEVFKKHMEDEEEYFPDRYQSFSEDLKVAQKFSKGIIDLLSSLFGFSFKFKSFGREGP